MQKHDLIHWERDFTRQFFRLALPIMVQSAVGALMFLVDNFMIGQLSESELAGVTQANRITFLFQLTMFGTVGGASVFFSQYWGKRDVAGVRQALGVGLVFSLVIASVFALPALLCPRTLMNLLIGPGAAQDAGTIYLPIVAVTYYMQAVTLMESSVLKSTEQVKLPMAASIAAIALNTCLNYLLIFGRMGFPRLGVQGAAIATVCGVLAEMLITLIASYRYGFANAARLHELRPKIPGFVPRFMRVVVPVMLNEAFWSLGTVMYSVAYGRMGEGAVAAISIFNNIEQLSSVILRGTTHACAVMIGMSIGAGREHEAQRDCWRMLLANLLGAFIMVIPVFFFSGLLVNQFNVSAQTALDAQRVIQVYCFTILLHAVNSTIIVGVMRPGGDVRYSMFLDTLPMWIISVPLVFLFGPGMGWPVYWVYAISSVEGIVKMLIGLRRISSGRWIHNLVRE